MVSTNITFRQTISGVDTIVTLGLVSFKEKLNKKLQIKLTPPVSTSKWDSGPNTTKIMDMLQIEQSFVLTCEIIEGLACDVVYGLTDTSSTCEGKKTDLINIIKSGGVFNIYVNSDLTPISVNLDGDISFDQMFNNAQTLQQDEVGYSVGMTLIKGINLQGSK